MRLCRTECAFTTTDDAVPSGLPTLDRDVLKLLFRNILAQKAVKNTAGTLIGQLAAINKTCSNAIGHVTNRFRTSIITSRGMTLQWDSRTPAIAVTGAQFVWLTQWGMLHPKHLAIASRNAREWQAFVEYFNMPSLETLRYVVPLHKPRKHTDNTSVDLAADIVKLNASSIKELDSMPMWKLSEPLPALRLRLFSYEPWPGAADDDLANLSGCVVEELRFNLEHYPWERVTLEVLAEVNVKKIVFQGDTTAFSWLSASEGTTNEHVRYVHFKTDVVLPEDIQSLRRFLPNLISIQIDIVVHRFRRLGFDLSNWQEIGQYLASDHSVPSLKGCMRLKFVYPWNETRRWTAENVRDEYDCVQDVRDAIAQMPPELHLCASVDAKFHRVGDAETKEADKLTSELGFNSEPFVVPCGSGAEYDYKVELSPGRELRVYWTVYDQAR